MITPYPTFEEINSPKLRAWNRLNVIFNIKERVNNTASLEYAKQFSKKDNLEIMIMASYVIKNGYEATRREILKKETNA